MNLPAKALSITLLSHSWYEQCS